MVRSRAIGVVAAVILALAGTYILAAYVRGAERRALAGEKTVEVLVVKDKVPAGTPVEQLASKTVTELVPVKVQAVGSVAALTDLAGQVTAVELVPGEQLVSTRFQTPEVFAAQREVTVPPGLLEVTIELEPERAVGGELRPGSTVAVLASFDPFEVGPVGGDPAQPAPATETARTFNTTHIILHKVLVTNVQAPQRATSVRPNTQTSQPDTDQPELAPSGNLLITLAIDAPSVERVVFTAEHGSLWLAVESTEASETGTRIQNRGTVYE